MTKTHEEYMQVAIDYAKQHNPIWPFAAILVDKSTGEIVKKSVNQSHLSPTKHGEVAVIDEYCSTNHNGADGLADLSHLIMYTTGECCPMCQSAAYWANIDTIVYGSRIDTLHALWPAQILIYPNDIIEKSPAGYKSRAKVIGPILEASCNALFEEGKRLQTQEAEKKTAKSHTDSKGALTGRYGFFAVAAVVAAVGVTAVAINYFKPSPGR